jgi:hypothetical protein
MRYISAFIIGCLAGVLLFWIISKKSPAPTAEVITKVVEKTDTVTIYEPVVVPELIFDTETIELEVAVKGETIIVPLQRESKTYKGDTYKAIVSGYKPSLDFIETYNRNITTTEYVYPKPKRFGLGIQTGVTLINGKLQSYVGLGLSWNPIVF